MVNQSEKNAYYCFNKEKTQLLKAEHPDWSDKQIKTEIITQWGVISSEDKTHYFNLVKKYKTNVSEEKVKKRPKSAYIHYSYHPTVRDKVVADHPDWKVTQIAKHLGDQWKSLDTTAKEPWYNLYKEEKDNLEKNPEWRIKKRVVIDLSNTQENRIADLEREIHLLKNKVQTLENNIQHD